MYQKILTGIILGICTREDIRCRRINSRHLMLYGVLAAAGKMIHAGNVIMKMNMKMNMYFPETAADMAVDLITEIAADMIPGMFFLAVSFLGKQSLGYGDSLLILISGISLGAEECLSMVMTAFFFAAVWALIQILLKRADGAGELPFVPFLLAGWGIESVLELMSGG